jgi:YfiH family protein
MTQNQADDLKQTSMSQQEVFQLREAPNGVQYLYIPKLDDTGIVRTFFTTRRGGVSHNPYDSLNFGKYTEDQLSNVNLNRKLVFEALAIKDPVLVFPRQVHGDAVACMEEKDIIGKNNITIEDTDAVITKVKNVILTTVHADCLVVYLVDLKNKVIGLTHAGWRGTKENITAKTIGEMERLLGAERGEIIAVIGPGIGSCCFEVGEEVYLEFSAKISFIDEFAIAQPDGKYRIDLKGINMRQLQDAGVKDVSATSHCTSCEGYLFFSHRRDLGVAGRMGAGISLI